MPNIKNIALGLLILLNIYLYFSKPQEIIVVNEKEKIKEVEVPPKIVFVATMIDTNTTKNLSMDVNKTYETVNQEKILYSAIDNLAKYKVDIVTNEAFQETEKKIFLHIVIDEIHIVDLTLDFGLKDICNDLIMKITKVEDETIYQELYMYYLFAMLEEDMYKIMIDFSTAYVGSEKMMNMKQVQSDLLNHKLEMQTNFSDIQSITYNVVSVETNTTINNQ